MAYKWLPFVFADHCTGCGLCVDACGPRCLAMSAGLAVLTGPDLCGSEAHCVDACKDDAIRMVWAPFDGSRAVGRWRGGWDEDESMVAIA